MLEYFFPKFIGICLITTGMFFIITALIGVIRFKEFFMRLHAVSISDSCGIPLTLVGASFLVETWQASFKLILIAVILMFTSPSVTHAIAKSAWVRRLNSKGKE